MQNLTELQVELIHLLEEEKLGATPYYYPINESVAANSESNNSKRPGAGTEIFKLQGICFGDIGSNTFYFTFIADGKTIVPRQMLTTANMKALESLSSEILVRSEIYCRFENGTGNTQTFDIVIKYTIYNANSVNDLIRRIGG